MYVYIYIIINIIMRFPPKRISFCLDTCTSTCTCTYSSKVYAVYYVESPTRNDCENEWRIQGLCPRTFCKSRMVGIRLANVHCTIIVYTLFARIVRHSNTAACGMSCMHLRSCMALSPAQLHAHFLLYMYSSCRTGVLPVRSTRWYVKHSTQPSGGDGGAPVGWCRAAVIPIGLPP